MGDGMSGASLDRAHTRSPRMVGRRVADEFILVPLVGRGADVDSILNLNRVGAFIWEQMTGGQDGHAIVRAMVSRFEVEPERAGEDYLDLVAKLESLHAVTLSAPILVEAPRPRGDAALAPSVPPATATREPYEPPGIRKVKLVADEVAVTGCKSNMVTPSVCRNGAQLVNFSRGS